MNVFGELKKNLKSVEHLQQYLNLSEKEKQKLGEILERFPLSITPYYLSLIDFEDENDPIRKMAIPSIKEADFSGSLDTSGEAKNTIIAGMQHKYEQAVLILSTNQCAMYCRHCFRKRLVGFSDEEVAQYFNKMKDYISEHTEVSNVLISGGDALLNDNARLKKILSMLVEIEHVDIIRICTRVPVVWPARITQDQELIELLDEFNQKKQLALITQFNHPKEFTDESAQAVHCIQQVGIPVKNQAVLLKGVNDDADVLSSMLKESVRTGVIPYYVFQCRPVTGVKNQFQVPLTQAIDIVEKARARQNGLGKAFRFCLSHNTGKIEVVGKLSEHELLFKYHEAVDKSRLGKVFPVRVSAEQAWLKEIPWEP